jgi:hypothetical protein
LTIADDCINSTGFSDVHVVYGEFDCAEGVLAEIPGAVIFNGGVAQLVRAAES